MKIGGVYILSRRSIARMIATITAALMTFYAATTAQAQATVHRIHDATVALVSLDRQMVGRLTRTVVPDFMYLEYKSLYLELKPSVGAGFGRDGARPSRWRQGEAACLMLKPSVGAGFGRDGARPSRWRQGEAPCLRSEDALVLAGPQLAATPVAAVAGEPSSEAARAPLPRTAATRAGVPVTKADLRAAVKTILRGGSVPSTSLPAIRHFTRSPTIASNEKYSSNFIAHLSSCPLHSIYFPPIHYSL